MAALNNADPIAGASDFNKAFAILDGLGMEALLDTLDQLKKAGGSWYQLLTSNP